MIDRMIITIIINKKKTHQNNKWNNTNANEKGRIILSIVILPIAVYAYAYE